MHGELNLTLYTYLKGVLEKMKVIYVLLGASLTINLLFIVCWKIMMDSIKKEVAQFKIQIEQKHQSGGN